MSGLLAHVGETHPLPWWVPVWVLLAAVALPLLSSPRAAAGVPAAPSATPWRYTLLVVTAGLAATAAAAVEAAGQGLAAAVGAAMWVGVAPTAALLGGWWRHVDPFAGAARLVADDAPGVAPGVRWPAVASLAVLAWLPEGLGGASALGPLAVLVVLAAVHLVGGIWHGPGWSPANDGLRALSDLAGHASPVRGGTVTPPRRWPAGPARALTGPEAALLAVAVASLAPVLARGLLPHDASLALLGPYPLASALVLAAGAAAAAGVGALVVAGVDAGQRGAALVALAGAWLVVGALARLVPTWAEGTDPAVAVTVAVLQLAVAAAGHAGAGAAVRASRRGEGARLLAALGLLASAGGSVVVVVGW